MAGDTEADMAEVDIQAGTRAEDTLASVADISGEATLVACTSEVRGIVAVILSALALILAADMLGVFMAASATRLWTIRVEVM